jgi:hypothetical protein
VQPLSQFDYVKRPHPTCAVTRRRFPDPMGRQARFR